MPRNMRAKNSSRYAGRMRTSKKVGQKAKQRGITMLPTYEQAICTPIIAWESFFPKTWGVWWSMAGKMGAPSAYQTKAQGHAPLRQGQEQQ